MQTVIFACVHNAGRSQMAAAFFNAFAASSHARAASAGTQPATAVHPEVVQAMLEVGLDLRQQRPRLLTDDLVREAALVVTMGCNEACPDAAHRQREEWFLPDPAGRDLAEVRRVRDEVRRRVLALIEREGWTRQAAAE